MKTFEKPLTLQEEQYYLQKYKEGDLNAKETLILRNLRLVAHMVKKYGGTENEVQDLISIGVIGLIKAINTFDLEKGSKFVTYAAKCIDNELLMHFRSEKRKAREVSMYEPVGEDKEGNEINYLDIIENDEPDVVEHLQMHEDIKKMYQLMDEILSEREKEILELRYGLNGKKEMTQIEIAKLFGISRSYVSRIESKAIAKMHKNML
ncbi:MAG: RNA polymerase sporulation sigma factor SigK [Lachnospiraceae bacterium]|nr:RNA polymerase sporulation sigma factor SigK [Lachnospiraceae bacterium]